MSNNLQADKDQIIAAVNGIAMYADSHEWKKCQVLFTAEPEIDYSSLSGQPAARVKVEALMEGWSSFLPKFDFTQHFVTNHRVTVKGDNADCFSYIHAIHHLAGAEGGELWSVYGTYEHELIKTAAGWKVSKMKFNLKYQDGNKSLPMLASKK